MSFIRWRDKAETRAETRKWEAARRAERQYAVSLRKVARHVGEMVNAFPVLDIVTVPQLQASLAKYSEAITPWATAVAGRMIADVSRRDEKVWRELGRQMGEAMRWEIAHAPTGTLLREFLAENVKLIRSLPTEAGERVHQLTLEAIVNSTRSKVISAEIMRSGEVTKSRANLIARTEVARTHSGLVMTRSLHIGSEGYIWRTAHDSDVRHSHRLMEGRFIRWDTPPRLSDGTVTHAGMIYNCRCHPEPVLPKIIT